MAAELRTDPLVASTLYLALVGGGELGLSLSQCLLRQAPVEKLQLKGHRQDELRVPSLSPGAQALNPSNGMPVLRALSLERRTSRAEPFRRSRETASCRGASSIRPSLLQHK